MPHYEKENLQQLIDKIKRQQEAIRSQTVSPTPEIKPPTPGQRPMTWEEMELEKQKKKPK